MEEQRPDAFTDCDCLAPISVLEGRKPRAQLPDSSHMAAMHVAGRSLAAFAVAFYGPANRGHRLRFLHFFQAFSAEQFLCLAQTSLCIFLHSRPGGTALWRRPDKARYTDGCGAC